MSSTCHSCAAEVPPGAKFCGQCGVAQALHCPACGTLTSQPGQRFCLECGAAIPPLRSRGAPPGAATAPATPPEAPEATGSTSVFDLPAVERRLVSVLFGDLAGFTAFSEGHDAEEVRQLVATYYAAARRITSAYGGTIRKYEGDGVMATWGAPVAREDDAERAVRAALDLVAAVTNLGDRLGLDLRLRVGVLTGEAAVDIGAVDQGMVQGDAVNTAARLQSIAEPGTVLVDDVTRLATERAIVYQDAGTHVVKGKAIPVQAWRPMRIVANVGGAGRTLLELPLVGRAAELDVLREELDRVLETRAELTLVSVVGEAGLGKSRLAWELEKYVDGLAATVLWHRGQASSFGEGVGFRALGDMVRMRARITLEDSRDTERTKLDALLDDVFASDADAHARVGRALRRLLGLDDGSALIDRGELFSSWRLLFERLADRHPVVLLFDDLHWADQGLFDFIAHMVEWASKSPILILVLSRPDERLDALSNCGRRLDLTPLAPGEVETLIAEAVSNAPAELLAVVRDHADGVPLFAVESLRMLADRGVMVAERDCGHLPSRRRCPRAGGPAEHPRADRRAPGHARRRRAPRAVRRGRARSALSARRAPRPSPGAPERDVRSPARRAGREAVADRIDRSTVTRAGPVHVLASPDPAGGAGDDVESGPEGEASRRRRLARPGRARSRCGGPVRRSPVGRRRHGSRLQTMLSSSAGGR